MHFFSSWHRGIGRNRANRIENGGHIMPSLSTRSGALLLAMRQSGLTKTEADDLLDWLEANGCCRYELVQTATDGFAVRWWN